MRLYLENFSGHVACKRMMPYWKKMGVVISNINDCNIQLVNVRTHNFSKSTVQRLDGIYYDSDTPYKQRNSAISNTHAKSAGIIYQSEYCRQAGEYYLAKRKGPNAVIYNGIEPGWCGEHKRSKHPIIVVSAKWRRHKRLPEILKLFSDYKLMFVNAELYVMGDLRGTQIPKQNGVKYLGHISHDSMKSIFEKSWFSIHLSKRDACPNTTVEAIGAGVPVLTTNACGGGTEMCNMTEGCVVVDGDNFTIKPVPHYRDKYNILSEDLHNRLLEAMIELTNNPVTVKLPEQLTVKYMAEQYIKFMRTLI